MAEAVQGATPAAGRGTPLQRSIGIVGSGAAARGIKYSIGTEQTWVRAPRVEPKDQRNVPFAL